MEYCENYEIIKAKTLELIEKSPLKNSIALIEVEHILPNGGISKKFTIEGRVSKKLLSHPANGWLTPLDELEEAVFNVVRDYTNAKTAAAFYEEYWLVSIGVSKNDKFTSLAVRDLKNEEVLLKVSDNQTLVIDVWATWCPYCQKPMAENMHLMKEKELLDLGIHIVGVSCDEDFQLLLEHLEKNNWNQIPQYNYPKIRKNLDIISIPCVIIINKDSVIKHVGSPNDMKFVESIKSIAKGGEAIVDFYDDVEDNVWTAKLSENEKKNLVQKINEEITDLGANKANFVLTSTLEYEGLNLKHFKCKPAFLGKINSNENEILTSYASKITERHNLRNLDNKCKVETIVISSDMDF